MVVTTYYPIVYAINPHSPTSYWRKFGYKTAADLYIGEAFELEQQCRCRRTLHSLVFADIVDHVAGYAVRVVVQTKHLRSYKLFSYAWFTVFTVFIGCPICKLGIICHIQPTRAPIVV